MTNSKLNYLIRDRDIAQRFKTGVSLHSHTMYSRESTAFVAKLADHYRILNWFFNNQLARYSNYRSLEEQCSRMWWTSPLAASEAYALERRQITDQLGLDAFVSLTDHDSIEGPLRIQMLADNDVAPISVEWTAPYGETYFHLGVHNLPRAQAVEMMQRMELATAASTLPALRDLLHDFSADPSILVILNHPYWDQLWLGADRHEHYLEKFIEEFGVLIHALEINGLRSWEENRKVVGLSRRCGMGLISGGDRHGAEPNATLNLTNAATFSEFVAEIRDGGPSEILVMPQFHDPLLVRICQTLRDIVRDHPDHPLGQVRWSDRVFRHCADDSIKPFTNFFPNGEPFLMRQIINMARLVASPRMRPAWQRMSFRSESAL